MENTINERFRNESETIDSYVSYIENNFYQRSCSVVKTQGYEDLSILSEYIFFSDTNEEKEENKLIIDQLKVLVDNKILELRGKLLQMHPIDLPAISERILSNDLVDVLVQYTESTVYDCMANPDNKEYFELIDKIIPAEFKAELDYEDERADEKSCDMLSEDDYVSILSYVRCKLYNEAIENTKQELEEYSELKTLYNIFDDKNPINIYRQAFILLMTAFDAATFDLFSNIFNQDFFNIARIMNYDKKFSLDDITKYQNFNEFASKTIDIMISGKYVSDVLEILHGYKNDYFLVEGSDRFEEIMEMVQRRNLHVHKNGIVDEKYFTKGNGSQLGIHTGDYSVIDNIYYNKASEILRAFITNIQ
ncbi:MAG: hypothetical protein RR313_10925 [Anaerovoracaceae bacterium]